MLVLGYLWTLGRNDDGDSARAMRQGLAQRAPLDRCQFVCVGRVNTHETIVRAWWRLGEWRTRNALVGGADAADAATVVCV